MGMVSREERFARIALSCVADPGDPVLGALLRRRRTPAQVLAAICAGQLDAGAGLDGRSGLDGGSELDVTAEPDVRAEEVPAIPGLARALDRWAARVGLIPTDSKIEAWQPRICVSGACPRYRWWGRGRRLDTDRTCARS